MTFCKRAYSALGRCAASTVALVFGLLAVGIPTAEASKPEPWQLGLQPPVSPAGVRIDAFHDFLVWVITVITIFVLGLLIYVCIRFKASSNPTPTRTSHNTVLEILWTGLPVLILVIIAVPSFTTLYYVDRAVDPDMTIKATASQWLWTYEYPDQELTFDSAMVDEADLKPGQLRLLEVDNRLVVPTGKKIQLLVTSTDVMHSFYVPATFTQIYGMPGRINETWMQYDREGLFYGQCNQICGTNHSFMPIVVEAVSPEAYEVWVKKAKKEFASVDETPTLRLAASAAPANQ